MTNPQALQQAQKEVDEIVGSGPITVEHLSKLPYLTACLRETLRLTPTIPGTAIGPLPNTKEDPIIIGGGKYLVKPGSSFTAVLPKVHRDPKVYGNDADKFYPERMLDEPFNKLPKNAWKVSDLRIAKACVFVANFWCPLAVWKWFQSVHWSRDSMARIYASYRCDSPIF